MIVAAWAADEPTEPVALAHRLASAGDLGRVGGAPYLFDLVDSVPASVMAVHYARLVRDAADRRQAEVIAVRMAEAAKVVDPEDRRKRLASVRDELEALESGPISASRIRPRGVPLDWSSFMTADFGEVEWLPGKLMVRGQQIALVGYGKVGKSLFMQEWVWRMACGNGFLSDHDRGGLRVPYVD